MIKLKTTTIFCIYTILSSTITASSGTATAGGFVYNPPKDKRLSSLVRVLGGPGKLFGDDLTSGTKLSSFDSLLNANGWLSNGNGDSPVPPAQWQRGKLQVYRNELLRLILKAKGDVETNLAYIKNIALKNPNGAKVILRMGDLVKFVESRYNKLVQLYSKLRTNRDALHLPKLVHVYEAILRGKHEIATILGIIHNKEPDWTLYPPDEDNFMDRIQSSIAWSYYDDNW